MYCTAHYENKYSEISISLSISSANTQKNSRFVFFFSTFVLKLTNKILIFQKFEIHGSKISQ